MSFSSTQSHRPLAGSYTQSSAEDNLVNQSRETGEVVPSLQSQNGKQITRDELKTVKPWAHFVAGGYVKSHGLLKYC